eukprot:TRINITY_DN1630_c0_g1_i1.p1 TRINITY_DN1630_c0_g1~~TRINITY_DN1630_c0_g1_i1.p1  ORF type:complete len:163 (+),score=29.99 TRINITY_DN1630_c0_g1_i1:133-621(+)
MGQSKRNEPTVRPCEHNDWDDVRTRNGFKVLRCRVCQGRWKLLSRGVKRCMAFLHDKCDDGASCGLMHVRRKKCNILERYERFGECVLKGVTRSVQRKTIRNVTSGQHEEDDDDEERSTESTRERCSSLPLPAEIPASPAEESETYVHMPYSWGRVTPPEFI